MVFGSREVKASLDGSQQMNPSLEKSENSAIISKAAVVVVPV